MHDDGVFAGRKRINLEPDRMRVFHEAFSKRLKRIESMTSDSRWPAICILFHNDQTRHCSSRRHHSGLDLIEKTLSKSDLLFAESTRRKMAGLETHYSCGTDALVLQLENDVDSFRRGRLRLEDLKRIAAAKTCVLETSLRSASDYRHACDCARAFTPSGNLRVYSQSISESGHYRITLLGIHRHSPVPVHDHPGMVSLVHLIEGQLHAPQYEITAHGCGNMLVELAPRSGQMLQCGDVAIVMPETGSLHSLKPLARNAVCLTLQLDTEQSNEPRSWYFPRALDKQGLNPALWYRIRNREICDGI
jgi:hypothetical protein